MNKMLFSDVAHLYKGCDLKVKDWAHVLQLVYVDGSEAVVTFLPLGRSRVPLAHVKPILKRCSSMTREQLNELYVIIGGNPDYECQWLDNYLAINPIMDTIHQVIPWSMSPYIVKWLLANWFDIFDLIDNGEAIELVEKITTD